MTSASAASIKDYIGSKVSLISASDVRYEGCLYTIDPEESTVALQRVRCMGTEYRRTGDQAIPPSDTTYEFIIFRGEHIKSLHVAEDQRSPSRNEQNPDMLNLLNFSSPNKGDKRSGGGARSNGVSDGYQDERSPPKRFVGIAPSRGPPRGQYDDYSRGGPVYDNRRSRRNSPPQYNQPPVDAGYQRYAPPPPPPGHYGPPVDRGYPQGAYRYNNRRGGGGGRRNFGNEPQWGYYPQQGYQGGYRRPKRRNQRNRQRGQGGQQRGGDKDKKDVVPGQGLFLQKVGQTKGDIEVPERPFEGTKAIDKEKLKEEVVKRVEESKTGPDQDTSSSAVDEKNEASEDASGTGASGGVTSSASVNAGQTKEESPQKPKYEMPEAAYSKNKGGFFDSLSTDRDQKVDKEALKQQRRVDEDTFGEIAKNYMSRHNRRRGGGGGGSRRWGGAQRGRQRSRRSRNIWSRK